MWKMIATRMRALLMSTTRIIPAGEVRTESSVYKVVSMGRVRCTRPAVERLSLWWRRRGEKRGLERSTQELINVVIVCVCGTNECS